MSALKRTRGVKERESGRDDLLLRDVGGLVFWGQRIHAAIDSIIVVNLGILLKLAETDVSTAKPWLV